MSVAALFPPEMGVFPGYIGIGWGVVSIWAEDEVDINLSHTRLEVKRGRQRNVMSKTGV